MSRDHGATLLTRIRDDMHLGPKAMKMIGQGIAQDIAAIRATSWFAHDVEESYEDEETPLLQDPRPPVGLTY